MQQNSRVDVISKLNGTICRLEDSVESLRNELDKLKRGNSDYQHYKNKFVSVENDNESISPKKNKSEHDITPLKKFKYIESTNGDVDVNVDNTSTQKKSKKMHSNKEYRQTVKEDGDILNESSKNPRMDVIDDESNTEILEIDTPDYENTTVNYKRSKKKTKFLKMKPLINFNERHARERLHSIKERIIALTQELPAIETQIVQENEIQRSYKDNKFVKSNYHQSYNNDNQVYYKNDKHLDINTTWVQQKNNIRDRLKAGSYTLKFKGSNISKIAGYGERIRN